MRSRIPAVALAALLMASLAPSAGAQDPGPGIRCVEQSVPIPVDDHGISCRSTHSSIQEAVAAADPGDAVLIGEGTYAEAVGVGVEKPGLIIRGIDRNKVILDGNAQHQIGIHITAKDVEVSNLTVRRYNYTGVRWTDTSGYHGRFVTVYNNRDYGLYAFGTRDGVFEDSYGSGQADAAFYIGNCMPCDAVIQRVVAENNALGYSGTNSSSNVVIRDSEWHRNGGGILPNTLDSQTNPPQWGTIIVNNLVTESGNEEAPARGAAAAALGIGIGISGGNHNIIEDNVVEDSSRYGIAIFPYPTTTPNLYRPTGNIVRSNEVSGSGLFDLSLGAPSSQHNCFSDNVHSSSDPPDLETQLPCQRNAPLRNSPVSGSALSSAELASGLVRFGSSRGPIMNAPPPPLQTTMENPTEGLPR